VTERTAKTRALCPEPSAKNGQGEYATFTDALKKVLSVPHSEMKSKLDAEKKLKPSSRASRDKY
jgi:hypothetical protein